MTVSVVVCTRNRSELIGDCLEALAANRYPQLEILVVDQSTDSRTEALAARQSARDPRVRHVGTPTVGLSRARNIGIRISAGEIVAFTDDDCVPASDWVEKLVAVFEGNPDADAVYGRSLPWEPVMPGERPAALKTDPEARTFRGRCNPWKVGHGNNMAFRRRVFDTVGLFDEALGPGGVFRNSDDADFTYRLLRSGLKAAYRPESLVYHKQFRHGLDFWRLEKDYNIGAGAMYAKHLRCGDCYALVLLLHRWVRSGMLHLVYGLLTGKRVHIRLGSHRIAYPVLGMWVARRTPVAASGRVFRDTGEHLDEQLQPVRSHLHP